MSLDFRYARRVQFAETDLAGIVHFSWMFRYMEEAEHAAWRAAGLSIADPTSDLGWPRVRASFDFRNPLRFEVVTRSLQYEHTIQKGYLTIGTGHITTACVLAAADGSMRAIEIPAEILRKLRTVLTFGPTVSSPARDLSI